ncbi:MAG TPA: hypothetical protein PKN33_05560 [Phycisphaerae bacterium]|nr:hypothetical protein [Phycisphaerae bacterium]
MRRKLLNLILACWALQISPALCLAGVISHPCDPAANDTCQHENQTSDRSLESDHPANEPDGSCSHEDDCSADPCQQVAATNNARVDSPHEQIPVLVAIGSETCAIDSTLPSTLIHTAPSPHRLCLPAHASDLPLLI